MHSLRGMTTTVIDPAAHPPSYWSAQRAALSRSRPADDPELVAARDALRFWRLKRAIDVELADLTPEHRQRLADLLLSEEATEC